MSHLSFSHGLAGVSFPTVIRTKSSESVFSLHNSFRLIIRRSSSIFRFFTVQQLFSPSPIVSFSLLPCEWPCVREYYLKPTHFTFVPMVVVVDHNIITLQDNTNINNNMVFLIRSRSVKTTLLVVFAILAVGFAGFFQGKSNATLEPGIGNGSFVESAASESS